GDYEGKVISVLGDSISTFAGYIPVADGFNLEHLSRYPQDDLLTDVSETWWMQTITALDCKLGINDSWRGATASGAHAVTTGSTGENAAMHNLTRIQNLGSNGTPDIILFYGGTNDLAHVSKVGVFDASSAPTAADLTTKKWDNLADGYVHTLLRLKHYYPNAQIVCLLPTYTTSYYSNAKLAQGNAVLASVCKHYGVPYVDLRDCGITTEDLPDGIHPNAQGMDYITEAVIDKLLNDIPMAEGENAVYPVMHTLTNATASKHYYKGVSAGKAFTETLGGNGLTVTVTMGGKDVTASVYKNGTVTIPNVTGEIVITAKGVQKPVYEDYLLQLPEVFCENTNLWLILEHNKEYYGATGWTVHGSGKVYSVTIPVAPGDRVYATSFGKQNENGGTINGIRATWFNAEGVLESVSADAVYAEFSKNGYLTAPAGATAINVPMWTPDDTNELYILNIDHSYTAVVTPPTCTDKGFTTHTCTICGDSYVDSYTEPRPLNILMIGNSFSWDAADFWYDMQESMTYDAMKSMLADPYDVHLAVMYKGSATLAYHATCAMKNTAGYTYTEIGPETNYKWTPSEGTNASNHILDQLQSRDWDIIVIQSYQHEADGTDPRSTYTGGDARFVKPADSLGYLLDYFNEHEPNAQVYYYMPWATTKFYGNDGLEDGYLDIADYTKM
ncbi:MAG: hypothetical protein IIV43_01545, partial [Oscillospiraceae bacterium]|nr:hypothetical protein [Oscillospiraceae bacterium]